jgi:hypothetical protein
MSQYQYSDASGGLVGLVPPAGPPVASIGRVAHGVAVPPPAGIQRH